jgi:hypothetical protein
MAIEAENHSHNVTVPAANIKMIATPAQVRRQRNDFSIVFACRFFRNRREQQFVLAHYPVDSLLIDALVGVLVQHRSDPAIAIERALANSLLDVFKNYRFVGRFPLPNI